MPCQTVRGPGVAIIGVGSPFGADRLGWLAIDALEGGAPFPALQPDFIRCDRPGALLIKQLRQVDAAVIIDAMRAGLAPGTIRKLQAEQLASESVLLSSHGYGVAHALALATALGELPNRLLILGIEMDEAFNEGALPVRVAVPLRTEIAKWLTSIQGANRGSDWGE